MENIIWHLETRSISKLKKYPKNPRILTKDQESHLLVSIDKFGLIDRPSINLDNTIIGGHQRLHILKKLEYDEVEVWVPNRMLNPEEVEECNIRQNKNTGEFDWDKLANEFEVEDLLQWGFTEEELGGINLMSDSEELEQEDENSQRCPQCNQKIKGKTNG